MSKIYFNAWLLPELPVVTGYSVCIITQSATVGSVNLLMYADNNTPYVTVGSPGMYNRIKTENPVDGNVGVKMYTATTTADDWTFYDEWPAGMYMFDEYLGIVWSNVDVLLGSATSSDIYFESTEPGDTQPYSSASDVFKHLGPNITITRQIDKNDDGTDTLVGASFVKFNNNIANNLYVSGNSWIGIGSNNEHLKVNRRDGASYTVFTETGKLFDTYDFLRVRFVGSSIYNSTSFENRLAYDVIFWSTGDISLHMINVPTGYYNGTFSLTASGTLTYTAPSLTNPDVTFYSSDDGNTSFSVSYTQIEFEPSYDKKYLVKSGEKMYNVINGVFNELPDDGQSIVDKFRLYGNDTIPDKFLLATLSNPTVMHWIDTEEYPVPILQADETARPFSQILYTDEYSMIHTTILGIERVISSASDGVKFSVSFDSGSSWVSWNGSSWNTITDASDGMTSSTLNGISSSDWDTVATTGKYKFRMYIPALTDFVGTELRVEYRNS